MLLRFTQLAEQDLESIADYIAADNPRRATTFVQELRQQCKRIALNPSGYRLRPELGEGIRSCAHGHYTIFFEATANDVTMVRILHGARDLPARFLSDGEI
ncbi:type II toxin-antitoxin system RelE/ParE family toxin [Acidithiobacillus sp.]